MKYQANSRKISTENNLEKLLDLADFILLAKRRKYDTMATLSRAWYNGRYLMAAKSIKTLKCIIQLYQEPVALPFLICNYYPLIIGHIDMLCAKKSDARDHSFQSLSSYSVNTKLASLVLLAISMPEVMLLRAHIYYLKKEIAGSFCGTYLFIYLFIIICLFFEFQFRFIWMNRQKVPSSHLKLSSSVEC